MKWIDTRPRCDLCSLRMQWTTGKMKRHLADTSCIYRPITSETVQEGTITWPSLSAFVWVDVHTGTVGSSRVECTYWILSTETIRRISNDHYLRYYYLTLSIVDEEKEEKEEEDGSWEGRPLVICVMNAQGDAVLPQWVITRLTQNATQGKARQKKKMMKKRKKKKSWCERLCKREKEVGWRVGASNHLFQRRRRQWRQWLCRWLLAAAYQPLKKQQNKKQERWNINHFHSGLIHSIHRCVENHMKGIMVITRWKTSTKVQNINLAKLQHLFLNKNKTHFSFLVSCF